MVVYGWFRCVIDEDDVGYRIVKLTGSQRFTGHFIDDAETSLIFYGAGHYADEARAGMARIPRAISSGASLRWARAATGSRCR